ncbi:MAG: hypothetical protein ACKVRP_01425 [Bacteroidota bacterium]
MIAAFLFILSTSLQDEFAVGATSEVRYIVPISREELREYVDDIGLFARHMPGVVRIQHLADDTYLYETSRNIPLGRSLDAVFHVRKSVQGDSVTRYESIQHDAQNFISCSVVIVPVTTTATSITISLHVRLRRESAWEVHWFAPVLGAGFISEQMSEDLDSMLQTFVANSNHELYRRFGRRIDGVDTLNEGDE